MLINTIYIYKLIVENVFKIIIYLMFNKYIYVEILNVVILLLINHKRFKFKSLQINIFLLSYFINFNISLIKNCKQK